MFYKKKYCCKKNHFFVFRKYTTDICFKVHIHDVKSLGRGDVDLVKEMEQVGLDTLKYVVRTVYKFTIIV